MGHAFHQWDPLRVEAGDLDIERDLKQNGDPLLEAVFLHLIISYASAVDHHPAGDVQFLNRLHSQGQIVEAKGGRLGNQEAVIALLHRFHYRA